MPPSNYFLFPTLITSRESPYQLFPEIGPKHRGLVKTPHSPISLQRGRLSVEISTGLEVARFSNVILLTCATAKLSGRHAGKVTLPIVTKRAKAPLRGGEFKGEAMTTNFPTPQRKSLAGRIGRRRGQYFPHRWHFKFFTCRNRQLQVSN